MLAARPGGGGGNPSPIVWANAVTLKQDPSRAVSASPKILFKMQALRLHPTPAASDPLPWGSAICRVISPPVTLVCQSLRTAALMFQSNLDSWVGFLSQGLCSFEGFQGCQDSLIAQLVKNPPAMQETPVRFLGQEDPLEKG